MSLMDGYEIFRRQLAIDVPEVAQQLFRLGSNTFYQITDCTEVDWSLYSNWGKYYLYRENEDRPGGAIYPFQCTTRSDKNKYYVTSEYTYFCHYSNVTPYVTTLDLLVFRNDRFKEPHDSDFVSRFYTPVPDRSIIEPITRLAEQRRNNNGTGI